MSRGFFFTVDAIIAALVLVAGIAIFFTAQPAKPDPALVASFARGQMNVLANTRLFETPEFREYFDNIPLPKEDVVFSDNSILEQMAEFSFHTGRPNDAKELAETILTTKPASIGVCLRLFDSGAVGFSYPDSCTGIAMQASVGIMQSRIIYFRTPEAPFSKGPYVAKLEVWQ